MTLLILAIVLPCCTPSEQGTQDDAEVVIDKEAERRLDAVLDSFVSGGEVVGASALVFEKGKEVYFKATGYADREAKVPMSRNTIVTIYSMTKPITGVTLMSLYEEGAFQLEDELSLHLPEFKEMQVAVDVDASGAQILRPADLPITVADVTRHTAGFSRRSDLGLDKLAGEADLLNLDSDLEQMVSKLSELPLGYQPGQRWEYGISVDVQARLVEKLSGRPFAQYMQEKVLTPLGMSSTQYYVPEEYRNRVAAIYVKTDTSLNRLPDEQVHRINYQDWSMKPGGWGLKSTIDDYMRFAQMLVNRGSYNGKKVLEPETVQLMSTNHLPAVEDSLWLPSKGRVGFGIDFAVRTEPPRAAHEMNGVVGEFFWDGAASTLFWVDPVNDLTVVLFVQIFPFQGSVHKRFRDAVYGPYRSSQ